MDKTNLDTLDNEIVKLLTENGRMPIGEMAKKRKTKEKAKKKAKAKGKVKGPKKAKAEIKSKGKK